jgi:hypothetical protein
MRILKEMQECAGGEQSLFRAQLLREDIARLETLIALAAENDSLDAFRKAGLVIGWTPGELRTHEIKEPLEDFLAAVFAYETGGRTAGLDAALTQAWTALDRTRMGKLVGCL